MRAMACAIFLSSLRSRSRVRNSRPNSDSCVARSFGSGNCLLHPAYDARCDRLPASAPVSRTAEFLENAQALSIAHEFFALFGFVGLDAMDQVVGIRLPAFPGGRRRFLRGFAGRLFRCASFAGGFVVAVLLVTLLFEVLFLEGFFTTFFLIVLTLADFFLDTFFLTTFFLLALLAADFFFAVFFLTAVFFFVALRATFFLLTFFFAAVFRAFAVVFFREGFFLAAIC